MSNKIYRSQIGVEFIVETQGVDAVDWSTATSIELLVRLPDGTNATWIPSLQGTTTLVYVTTSESDLPIAGTYLLQARVVGSGYDALGETASFPVFAEFK